MFDSLLESVFMLIFIITIAILILFGGIIMVNGCNYLLDQSMCTAYVENQQVYQGRCHFLSISSIGENGNSKRLTIYKDKFGLKPVLKYVNENIKIQEN